MSDGTIVFMLTGSVTVSYTNAETGKTILVNESGPATETDFTDGTVVVASKGRQGPLLVAADAARFGLPPLTATAGLVTQTFVPDGTGGFTLASLSLQGHVLLDICAALS
jgi:hypothetical protein